MSILQLRKKGVFRKTVEPFDHHGRRIVVGIEPGDVLTFREERCRKTYVLDIKWAFRQAVKMEVDKKRAEKRKLHGLSPHRYRPLRSLRGG